MKLTREEYSFFAQHAPREFDLSRLHPEPCPEKDDSVTVDREAFIVMAGITDHIISAPVDKSIDVYTRKTTKMSHVMLILIPSIVVTLAIVVALIVNEIYL